MHHYSRPFWLFNAHLETIWPSLMRRPPRPAYRRERIATADADFLDLDWVCQGQERLVIISHGLEGDSQRAYVAGMVNAFSAQGWDALAWNFRGCSGTINQQPRFTHNGATEDLQAVISHALASGRYRKIALVGFSMGGNLSLVYLGRESDQVPVEVCGAVLFSVPCDLEGAADRLAEPANRLYMKRFLRLMGAKVAAQALRYPGLFPTENYRSLSSFHEFDARYTAPLHGFADAREYWTQSSSLRYLETIQKPVWIINAVNDPFLSPNCFPQSHNPLVRLVTPQHGGHCGFTSTGNKGRFWSEIIAPDLLGSL